MSPDTFVPADPSAGRVRALGLAPMVLPRPARRSRSCPSSSPTTTTPTYVQDSVASVLAQTYSRLDVVIVDDGSTDGSQAVLAELADDPRVTVVSQDNAGQAVAINAGFEQSSGDIVCLLDADDLFEPTRVARTVEMFRAAPRAGLAVCRMLTVDARNASVCATQRRALLSQGWCAPHALGDDGPPVRLPLTSALAPDATTPLRSCRPIDPTLRGCGRRLLTPAGASSDRDRGDTRTARSLPASRQTTSAPRCTRRRRRSATGFGRRSMLTRPRAEAPRRFWDRRSPRRSDRSKHDAAWVWMKSWSVLIEDASAQSSAAERQLRSWLARNGAVRPHLPHDCRLARAGCATAPHGRHRQPGKARRRRGQTTSRPRPWIGHVF